MMVLTELVCYEPGCHFQTCTPFPACIEELAAHDCPEEGGDRWTLTTTA